MPVLQRTGKEITEIYNRQVDTVYRICFSFMKNTADAEDMVQETFLRLISGNVVFQSEEHEKAWLIVTASNLCRDTLKKWWRKTADIDDPTLELKQPPFEIDHVLEAILKLPSLNSPMSVKSSLFLLRVPSGKMKMEIPFLTLSIQLKITFIPCLISWRSRNSQWRRFIHARRAGTLFTTSFATKPVRRGVLAYATTMSAILLWFAT